MELTLLSEGKQRDAAINWLRQQPGSLLILDNIDAEPVGRMTTRTAVLDWNSRNLALIGV